MSVTTKSTGLAGKLGRKLMESSRQQDIAEEVRLDYFEWTCDLEWQIRDSLIAGGFHVVDSDHCDHTLDRNYEFDSEADLHRCLALLEPLNKELYCFSGHGIGAVEDEPRTMGMSVNSLWAVASYLRRNPWQD